MNFLKRLKLWEWLLIVAVIFLGCIAYELHKAPGRYVALDSGADFNGKILNTKTGTWKYAEKDKNQNKNRNRNKNKNKND